MPLVSQILQKHSPGFAPAASLEPRGSKTKNYKAHTWACKAAGSFQGAGWQTTGQLPQSVLWVQLSYLTSSIIPLPTALPTTLKKAACWLRAWMRGAESARKQKP